MKREGKSKVVDKSISTSKGKKSGRGATRSSYTLAGKRKSNEREGADEKTNPFEKKKFQVKSKATGKFPSGNRTNSIKNTEFTEKNIPKETTKSYGKSKSFSRNSKSEGGFIEQSENKYGAKRKSADSVAKPKSREPKLSDSMRLNRFLANAGICSRREADKYIESGIVTINGKVVTELGTKVNFDDVVKFNDAPLAQEKKTYVLLNKPKDYVTTLDDPHAKKTVMDLISSGCKERVYPVGRLDKATTGLLLLTNDGDLAEFLSHPRNNKKKIYQATLNKAATLADLQMLADGVKLEDGMVKADEISFIDPADKTVVGIEIHSGKNRVVRRMFEHIGFDVKKLDRVYYAGLTKKNLPRGKWRFLSDKEVVMLKRGIFA